MKSQLSKETVRQMAELIGLHLSEERLERLAPRIEAFIREMKSLEELDLEGVEPAFIAPLKGE